MTGKNKINKAILILKSIGLVDELRQSWKDIFHIWRVYFKQDIQIQFNVSSDEIEFLDEYFSFIFVVSAI